MAEFPGLGRHCNFAECHLLDFLPVRCDACRKDFCAAHYPYDSHRCESSYKKDVQVPVCPLCGKPVPVARGELPDERVGRHIDMDCKSDPALASKGKIYTNRCSMFGCRKRELVPIRCKDCGMNFCIKHRFPSDHDCGMPNCGNQDRRPLSDAAKAALARQRQTKQQTDAGGNRPSNRPDGANLTNGTPSEDEALARAIQASLNDLSGPNKKLTVEERDAALAEQLQRSEYISRQQRRAQRVSSGSSSDSKCVLS